MRDDTIDLERALRDAVDRLGDDVSGDVDLLRITVDECGDEAFIELEVALTHARSGRTDRFRVN